ncbi:MAG: hypothetical protein O3B76_04480 [Proteobacteria bacterium]|nr:hypothetical protein [Pseudomonadota bacterium]MDA1023924.1 hypothetical protein [Pseudomonadota bacterium]
MSTSAGIFKFCFVLASCLLLVVALSPRPAHAIHGGGGCVFTLNIPKKDIYPLIRRLRGDDDIDGNSTSITIDTLLEQPPWKRGEKPKVFQLDVNVKITELGGDGSIYEGGKTYPISNKWIKGGTVEQIHQCLNGTFKTCVGIFAKEAKTEAQLMAQCTNASVWRVKERFKVKSPSNNRRWTVFKPKSKGIIKSANCLPDANGRDAGNIGCKDITFRDAIRIDINFGHKPLKP